MKNEITIPELIRHLNHEFLNKINLIQMYIDLGKIDDCKRAIQEMAKHCQTVSNIQQLKCPKLITWISTFTLRFPDIKFELISNISKPLPIHLDEKIENYLNQTILHVYDTLNPFEEQKLRLTVQSTEKFEIEFDLKGNWNTAKFNTKEDEYFFIETYEQTNQSWKYVIRAK